MNHIFPRTPVQDFSLLSLDNHTCFLISSESLLYPNHRPFSVNVGRYAKCHCQATATNATLLPNDYESMDLLDLPDLPIF